MSIQLSIQHKIQTNLNPSFLSVENESHFHSVPKGSETHFKVLVVSSAFEGLRLLARHRLLNEVLSSEMAQIKACSLHTFTPDEWATRKNESLQSPKCVGGSKLR